MLAGLVFFAILPLWSQQGQQTMVLIGEIRIARGSFPPHRIQVNLETRGATAQVTYADEEGKFLFAELWPNVYYVVINDPDFEAVRQPVEMRALSGNTTVVQVMLAARDHGPQTAPKDNTSGGNPFLVNTSEYAILPSSITRSRCSTRPSRLMRAAVFCS